MKTYTTIQGQTWDQVSKEIFGTELQIGALMAANPKQLDVFVFSSGVVLNIPEIKKENINMPPWRK